MGGSVPYFCQWETPSLAADLIAGKATLADDPNWAASGARDRAEYATWANHVCGMACFKMILAARTGRVVPTLELARRSLSYGAYRVEGDDIRGLIYAPFVTFAAAAFGIAARVVTDVEAADLPGLLVEAEFFMASVHPWVRWPDREPPQRGGHLVLVTSVADGMVTFHNPSGHEPATQSAARLPVETFGRFFAGRGIAVPRAT
jgi:hypothetical protein